MNFESWLTLVWLNVFYTYVYWDKNYQGNWWFIWVLVLWVASYIVVRIIKSQFKKRKQPKGEFIRRSRPLGFNGGDRHNFKN